MEKEKRSKLKVTHLFSMLAGLLVILVVLVGISSVRTGSVMNNMQETTNRYIDGHEAIDEMQSTSDYLTREARAFVVRGTKQSALNYFRETDGNKNRQKAVKSIKKNTDGEKTEKDLEAALNNSEELTTTEHYAMRIAAEGYGIKPSSISKKLVKVKLSKKDAALSDRQKINRGIDLMFNDAYQNKKQKIIDNVEKSKDSLVEETHVRNINDFGSASRFTKLQQIMILLIMIATVLIMFITARNAIIPIKESADYIKRNEKLPEKGIEEYRYLAETYNRMLSDTKETHEKLSYDVTHDELTKIFNRKVFDDTAQTLEGEEYAMIILDVDYFKNFNDSYGHDVGDLVLKKVADIISSCFRFEDVVCRIGGDEFVVIMKHMDRSLQSVCEEKINMVRKKLAVQDELPKITLSIGAAFSEAKLTFAQTFKQADNALYITKENGRNGYTIL